MRLGRSGRAVLLLLEHLPCMVEVGQPVLQVLKEDQLVPSFEDARHLWRCVSTWSGPWEPSASGHLVEFPHEPGKIVHNLCGMARDVTHANWSHVAPRKDVEQREMVHLLGKGKKVKMLDKGMPWNALLHQDCVLFKTNNNYINKIREE